MEYCDMFAFAGSVVISELLPTVPLFAMMSFLLAFVSQNSHSPLNSPWGGEEEAGSCSCWYKKCSDILLKTFRLCRLGVQQGKLLCSASKDLQEPSRKQKG